LGDPQHASAIPGIAKAESKLQEGPLRELAAQTGGQYIADHDRIIDVSGCLGRMIAGPSDIADELTVARVPAQPAPFLVAGLGCLILGLVGIRWRPVVASATLLTIAAGPIENWIRRGNDQLAAGDAEAALTWYAKAAERTPDPGQVAFNQ